MIFVRIVEFDGSHSGFFYGTRSSAGTEPESYLEPVFSVCAAKGSGSNTGNRCYTGLYSFLGQSKESFM